MAISESQLRLGIAAGAVALAIGIGSLRFCGSAVLPPKTVAKPPVTGTSNQLMNQSAATQSVYADLLAKDATAAGVRAPTADEMRQPLKGVVDDQRHVLEVGAAPVQIAGLSLAAQKNGGTIALEITNTTEHDLAYLVETVPTPSAPCNSAQPLPFNAMVLAKGQKETRVECVFRSGMVIAVTRVETLEVSPLSAWYLAQTPPELVGIEERIARGHRGPQTKEKCSPLMGEALRSRIENREIRWRDLVDFFARHRCQTFQFPLTYKAFVDGDTRELPVRP